MLFFLLKILGGFQKNKHRMVGGAAKDKAEGGGNKRKFMLKVAILVERFDKSHANDQGGRR